MLEQFFLLMKTMCFILLQMKMVMHPLILSISDPDDESSSWNFNVELEILSPNITIENVSLSGGTLNPGQTIDLEIDFLNIGYQVLESSHINLISNTSLIDVVEFSSEVGDINLHPPTPRRVHCEAVMV